MRKANLDFQPRPSYISVNSSKQREPAPPVPPNVVVQVIVNTPAPIEPWLIHTRDLRKIMSQKEIALAAGISEDAISRYINRTHNPGPVNAEKIRKLWEDLCS